MGAFHFRVHHRRQLMVREIRCVLQPQCGCNTQPLLLNWNFLPPKLEYTQFHL